MKQDPTVDECLELRAKKAETDRDWNAVLEDVAVAFDRLQRPYMAREIRAIKRNGG